MRSRISVFLYPAVVAGFLAAFLIRAFNGPDKSYTAQASICALLICGFWILLFVSIQVIGMRTGRFPLGTIRADSLPAAITVLTMLLCIGWFDACNIWGREYLSLFPALRIDSGSVVLTDTLFHASLSEGFRGGLRPLSLQNYPHAINYHTLSHLLLRFLAAISGLTPFLAYNFLYPAVFLPLYALAQLFALRMAGRYFRDSGELTAPEMAVLTLFHIGIFGGTTLYRLAIYKAHYLTSESFLVANTLLFFYFGLTFLWLKKELPAWILLILITPAAIFLASWAKVSDGALLAGLVMWYLFRMGRKDIRCWLCNLLYLIVFLAAMKLFLYTAGDFSGSARAITLHLSLYPYTKTVPRFIGHVLYLAFWPALWAVFAWRKNRYHAADLVSARTIWIEEALVITLAGFLPDLLLHDFNSLFFSHIIPIPAVVLLCGSGMPEDFWESIKRLTENRSVLSAGMRRGVCAAGMLLFALFCVLQTKRSISHPFEQAALQRKELIYEKCLEIRSLAEGDPAKCAIYLEPGVCGTQTYDNDAFVLTAYTGLTGMEVINATYREDGKQYTFSGQTPGAGGYALDLTNEEGRLSPGEAVERAREQGFSLLIHVTANGNGTFRIE